MPRVLSLEQEQAFERDGCLYPVRAMTAECARRYRDRFEALEARVPDIKKMKTKSHLLLAQDLRHGLAPLDSGRIGRIGARVGDFRRPGPPRSLLPTPPSRVAAA